MPYSKEDSFKSPPLPAADGVQETPGAPPGATHEVAGTGTRSTVMTRPHPDAPRPDAKLDEFAPKPVEREWTEPPNEASSPAVTKPEEAAVTYSVAPGHTLCCGRGTLQAGESVTEIDVTGGKEQLEVLAASGHVVRSS